MKFLNLNRITYRRQHFISSIPKDNKLLEIGPFYNPVCKGIKVKYFDIIDQDTLKKRASLIDENIEINNIPFIDYVSSKGDLSIIKENFDIVISCHCIEHQLDLIDHLQKISNLLTKNGKYYIIIPDKRYCFDYYNNTSTIAEVINSNNIVQVKHSLKSVIEHRSLTTHNNPKKHWLGIHGNINNNTHRIKNAINEFLDNDYVDVHSWYFTPTSFSKILNQLNELGYID